MRLLLQRVKHAKVTVDGRVTGEIGEGLLVLAGLGKDDHEGLFEPAIRKMLGLRIFPDGEGVMNRSVEEAGGAILAVSQFTLYADARKGRRPSYINAMPPGEAEPLFAQFVAGLKAATSLPVETGEFGAMMNVELVNWGPVTIWLDSEELKWG